MNIYKSLAYKDYKNLGLPCIIIVLGGLFVSCATITVSDNYILLIGTIGTIFLELPISSLYRDRTYGFSKYQPFLMMKKSQCVNSSFLLLLLLTAIELVVMETFAVAGNLIHGQALFGYQNLLLINMVLYTMFAMSVGLSFIIFGHQKCAVITMCLMAGFFGGLLAEFSGGIYGEDLPSFITNIRINAVVLLVCLILTVLVWCFTVYVYNRRDYKF